MREIQTIPIFPLKLLPLPQEYIPLHIFEPRYRQLIEDLGSSRKGFGIFYSVIENQHQLGGYLEMESMLKQYPGGESDILCKCIRPFILLNYYQHLDDRLYPGGEVYFLPHHETTVPEPLYSEFRRYLSLRKVETEETIYLHDVANELNPADEDRLRYLQLIDQDKKVKFLQEQLRYRLFILEQEKKFKGNTNLN